MNLPPLILASASPRRAALLGTLGLVFEVIPGRTEEVQHAFLTPSELARLNARNKAAAVAAQHPAQLILGADTVVCLDNVVFGKPADQAEAKGMLAHLQGRSHQVITGVCLLQRSTRTEKVFAVDTMVRFRSLTAADIERYLTAIDPLDKAGAYAIQEHGDWIIESIEGSYSNVVGLPLERLEAELEELSHGQKSG